MDLKHRQQIENFEDILIEKTNFKKVYTHLLRWGTIPVHLKAFQEDLLKGRSDKENNKILYSVIKSRGITAFAKLKQALQLSNPELLLQFEGKPWKITWEQWSCSPQVYNLTNADELGFYKVVMFTEDRSGWTEELKNFKDLFRFLNYKGSVSQDPSEKELDELLWNFTDCSPNAGCYIFTLSGHGQGTRTGDGDESVRLPNKSYKNINQIISKIGKAPSLLNKPKIIILQICRGGLEDMKTLPYQKTFGTSFGVPNVAEIPGIKDTIILRPCLPRHVAYRNAQFGGWFIDLLTKMVKQFARDKDVEEIMIEVSKELAKMRETKSGLYGNFDESRKMTPCANAYSFKKFYFLPKNNVIHTEE